MGAIMETLNEFFLDLSDIVSQCKLSRKPILQLSFVDRGEVGEYGSLFQHIVDVDR